MLVDAGPLVAIINKSDQNHDRCVQVLPALALPLLTTEAVLTEALYFLGKRGGWRWQATLWEMRRQGKLDVKSLESANFDRAAELMEKYQDSPMDFADASLVALAEARGERQIFTLDRYFKAYRLPDRRVFHIVPDDV